MSWLFRPAWCPAFDVDENDRQLGPSKRFDQRECPVDHFRDGVDELSADNALLKVNNDESGVKIECRERQGIFFCR